MTGAVLFVGGVLLGLLGPSVLLVRRRIADRSTNGTGSEQATYRILHTASRAAPLLRAGLTMGTAGKAAPHLRELLDAPALAICDQSGVLAWSGGVDAHRPSASALAATVAQRGLVAVFGPEQVDCGDADCALRSAVAAPLMVEGTAVGVIIVYVATASVGLTRAVEQVAIWAAGQLELAELEQSKARIIEAEVRALRAQISPHFIYNSLTAIASFVRSDPERARNLLVEFAEFTRYSFRRHGEFTSLAEELRSIDQYLNLERARFGERLTVTLKVAPEVLPVAVPFLCIQPLVENAVRYGMDAASATHITILAEDGGADALISVADDGAGMDPDDVRRVLNGQERTPAKRRSGGTGIALVNIDERLRHVYGQEYGIVVETGIGAGTKINLRVPKYRAGVHAST